MIDWLARRLGYVKAAAPRQLRAKFDAASNAPEVRELYRNADGLSINAAADPVTRATMRNRARHERFNNPYMCGQLRTLANDTIGVGPALQLLTSNEIVNSAVEARWEEWARVQRLGAKLRLARAVRACDGEVFIRLRKNPRLKCAVKLDLQLIEADQVATPEMLPNLRDLNIQDGIEYDEYDNPVAYYVLRQHPGDVGIWRGSPLDHVRIPAEDIIHYYLVERPGQRRGIPEVASSLNTHSERRHYRASVLTAARAAASLGAVMLESEFEPDGEELPEAFSSIPIEQGSITTMPAGTEAKQMRPEQPSTGYGDLSDRLITEQARPLNMPRNVASGDSSNYNYASGRLDHQTYDRSNVVEQDDDLANVVLAPTFAAWCIEATAIPGYLPGRAGQIYLPTRADPDWPAPCAWIWGERDHVDPAKEANAQDTHLRTRTTTYAREFARVRKDWRTELEQAGREHEALDDAGLIKIDPQFAPRILEVLRNVLDIGDEAAVALLTLMGVSRPKAARMVAAAHEAAEQATAAAAVDDDLPPRIRDRMTPAGTNGNGNGQGGTNGRA